jgi:hypothetical protein
MSGAATALATGAADKAAPAKAPSLVGYLDASSGTRLFGWAWDPERPAARIAIRLIAKGDTVLALIADRPRADLKANGIGDGAHAFEVELPSGFARADIEIRAVCAETGETIALAPPPPQQAEGEAATSSNEVLVRLVRSHQLLHRTMSEAMAAIAELRERSATVTEPMLDPASDSRMETIEAAIFRIDGLVAEQSRARDRTRRGSDLLTRTLSGIAAVLAGVALLMAFVK